MHINVSRFYLEHFCGLEMQNTALDDSQDRNKRVGFWGFYLFISLLLSHFQERYFPLTEIIRV